MSTKTLFLVVIAVCIILGGIVFFFISHPRSSKITLNAPEAKKDVTPSKTFIDYTDPAGFSFSYPDNISISNRASGDSDSIADPDAYADLQLFSKDKSGSLNIRIADTKFKTVDEWLKDQGIPKTIVPVEKTLGNLKAYEVKTKDRLMLASIDQGVLFTMDAPLIEEAFWMEVYNQVLNNFAFAAPEKTSAQAAAVSSTDEVVFEGEEVVE